MKQETWIEIQADSRFDKKKHIVDVPAEKITGKSTAKKESQVRKGKSNAKRVGAVKTSIDAKGQIVPITVVKDPDNTGQYFIMDGNTRYEAISQIPGMKVRCCTFHEDVVFKGLEIDGKEWYNFQTNQNDNLPTEANTRKDVVHQVEYRITHGHLDEALDSTFANLLTETQKKAWIREAATRLRSVYSNFKLGDLREIVTKAILTAARDILPFDNYSIADDIEMFNKGKIEHFGGKTVEAIGQDFFATKGPNKGKRHVYYRVPRPGHVDKEILAHATRVKSADKDAIIVIGMHEENVITADDASISSSIENMIGKCRNLNKLWYLPSTFKYVDVVCVYPQNKMKTDYHVKKFVDVKYL